MKIVSPIASRIERMVVIHLHKRALHVFQPRIRQPARALQGIGQPASGLVARTQGNLGITKIIRQTGVSSEHKFSQSHIWSLGWNNAVCLIRSFHSPSKNQKS